MYIINFVMLFRFVYRNGAKEVHKYSQTENYCKKRWITEKSLQDAINAVKNQEVSKRAASKKLVYLE